MVETCVTQRDTRYVSAKLIAQAYYDLGDYGAHMDWFEVRERDKDSLVQVPMDLRDRPDYWDRLSEWVLEIPVEARSRMARADEHRSLIDRITEKMVLPHDFVA